MLAATIDQGELYEALRLVLIGDADLLAEVDELFFGENARYETTGVVSYVFTIAPTAADGTNCQHVAIVCRDKDERSAVLMAPEKHGLIERRRHALSLRHDGGYVKCNIAKERASESSRRAAANRTEAEDKVIDRAARRIIRARR